MQTSRIFAETITYNTSEHVSIGFTPFYLMFGRQVRIPLDEMYGLPPGKSKTCCQYVSNLRHSLEMHTVLIARQNSLVCARRQKEYYDLKVQVTWYGYATQLYQRAHHASYIPHGMAHTKLSNVTGSAKTGHNRTSLNLQYKY